MSINEVVVLGGVRTAIGDYGGSLKSIPACESGAKAVRVALDKTGVDPKRVGHCVIGNVLHSDSRDMFDSMRARSVSLTERCRLDGRRHRSRPPPVREAGATRCGRGLSATTWIALLLTVLLFAGWTVAARAQTVADDRAALMALYTATDGANWHDDTN